MVPLPAPPLPPDDLEHILDHTSNLWHELNNGRIFITGASGFFGVWLLESLLWATDRLRLAPAVVVLTRDPDAFRVKLPHLAEHRSVQLLGGSLADFQWPSGTFTHAVHAALESANGPPPDGTLRMLDSIMDGTRRVLDFATASGVSKLLFTSSGAIYGRQPSTIPALHETYPGAPDPLDANSTYGIGKRIAEHLCRVYSRDDGLAAKVVRPFAFIGPHLPMHRNFAVGNFLLDLLENRPITVKGDGTPLRSYLYAADLAIWLWTILFRGNPNAAYNVGSEHAISIRDLAQHVATRGNPSLAVLIQETPNLNEPPSRYIPDTSRARTELGLTQRIALSDAIDRTLKWNGLSVGSRYKGPSR